VSNGVQLTVTLLGQHANLHMHTVVLPWNVDYIIGWQWRKLRRAGSFF